MDTQQALEVVQSSTIAQAQRKFELTDVTVELMNAAACWLKEYTGAYPFLLNVRNTALYHQRFTKAQAKGVLNCMLAALAHASHPSDTDTDADSDVQYTYVESPEQGDMIPASAAIPAIADGYYTILLNGNTEDYVTLRIKTANAEKFGSNTQIVGYLNGPDNESAYQGFAFLKHVTPIIWKAFRAGYERQRTALQTLVQTDVQQAGLNFALTSGRCYRCNRMLTVPSSLYRGMGPECYKRSL